MKTHSYRQLDKRKTASYILFYLQDPQDALTIFDAKHKNFNSQKSEQQVRAAFEIAEYLKQETKAGNKVSLNQYSPFVNQIKELLNPVTPTLNF